MKWDHIPFMYDTFFTRRILQENESEQYRDQ